MGTCCPGIGWGEGGDHQCFLRLCCSCRAACFFRSIWRRIPTRFQNPSRRRRRRPTCAAGRRATSRRATSSWSTTSASSHTLSKRCSPKCQSESWNAEKYRAEENPTEDWLRTFSLSIAPPNAGQLLSGSLRVDSYNRHLDIVYQTYLLLA